MSRRKAVMATDDTLWEARQDILEHYYPEGEAVPKELRFCLHVMKATEGLLDVGTREEACHWYRSEVVAALSALMDAERPENAPSCRDGAEPADVCLLDACRAAAYERRQRTTQ